MQALRLITTAIDYTNAPPHLGHAYEKILADVLARYRRSRSGDVFFLTGVDQHGQKVQQAAARDGVEPAAFVAALTPKFTALWERLGIGYDGWAATTDPRHVRCVQGILSALHAAGDLYRATYRGFYSVRQEQFLTDKERGPDGEFGPEWGEVVELEEENWYFRLSKYRAWLLDYIDRTPGLVEPSFRQTELRNAVERGSGDLSISRPKSRLSWGIELPFDPECVTYVWFDALTNYISFAGYKAGEADGLPSFDRLWPALHVIGKDILVPAHGIYWMAMLKAIGFADDAMPRFLVHGYVTMDGEKMSKSLGNIRDPHAFVDAFGAEALRYYLMRDCAVGQDMDFTDGRLVQRYNTDLANSLGNLLNRTLNMAWKYREGRLTATVAPAGPGPMAHVGAYMEAMDAYQVHRAIEAAMAIAVDCNAFIDSEKPWALAKDPAAAGRLDAVLYHLAEALRLVAILLAPVIPRGAAGIFEQLGLGGTPALADARWGLIPDGHVVGRGSPLFPRLEAPAAE
jgi:methionyl-tRNA synthetase